MTAKLKRPDKGLRLLTSLHANPENPRKISPDELKRLNESLKQFGDLGGIILNRTTGRLVGGHQRLSAFAKAEVPATITEELKRPDRTGTIAFGYITLNGTRYSYREVLWPTDKERVANIAANKIGGDWDDKALASVLSTLQAKPNGHVTETGFSDEEVTRLLASSAGTRTARRRGEPTQGDDEYSLFELIMLHENKRKFVALLDAVRNAQDLKTLEEAIMWLVEQHEGKTGTK